MAVVGKQQPLFASYGEKLIQKQLEEDHNYARGKLQEWEALDWQLDRLIDEKIPGREIYGFALSNSLLKRRVFTSGVLLIAYYERGRTADLLKQLVNGEKERLRKEIQEIEEKRKSTCCGETKK